jgi:hypothetical protein
MLGLLAAKKTADPDLTESLLFSGREETVHAHPTRSFIFVAFAAFGAEKDELLNVTERARARGVQVAIYTEDLFTTYNDVDNRAAVAAVPTADLKLVGVAVYADRRVADKILKGLRLLTE